MERPLKNGVVGFDLPTDKVSGRECRPILKPHQTLPMPGSYGNGTRFIPFG
ncbi:MAG: hypothetical protein R2681_17765 [Pyrinomonadaceae bacterium]